MSLKDENVFTKDKRHWYVNYLSFLHISIKTKYIFLENHTQTFLGNFKYYKIHHRITCHVYIVHNRRDPYLSMLNEPFVLTWNEKITHAVYIFKWEISIGGWQIRVSTKPYTQGNTLSSDK